MALSHELVSEFVKVTNDQPESSKESTMTGVIVERDGKTYVKLDGSPTTEVSEVLTPIAVTTSVKAGDRVKVTIANHTATVIGNLSSPSARNEDLESVGNDVLKIEGDLTVRYAQIDTLVADDVVIKEQLTANNASIKNLEAEDVRVTGLLTAQNAEIENLKATSVTTEQLVAKYATIESLNAVDAKIYNLDATYASIERLEASEADISTIKADYVNAAYVEAEVAVLRHATANEFEADRALIDDLNAKKLSVEEAEVNYANIDFANIKMAAIQKLFSDSGIIKDLVVDGQRITGELVGVTIKGDLVEAGTLKADRLVVKGSDGIFYKLNVEVGGISAEKAPTDSLHGSVITTKSIVAEQIAVSDLVAFGATIGGFHITDHSLYSGAKNSATNTTRGIFLGDDGQIAFGDSNDYVKFYKDGDLYKLDIAASSLSLGASKKSVETIADDAAKSRVDSLQVGGRNLFRDSHLVPLGNYNGSYPISVTTEEEDGVSFTRYRRINTENLTGQTIMIAGVGVNLDRFNYAEMTGKQVTFSFKARSSFNYSTTQQFNLRSKGVSPQVTYKTGWFKYTTEWDTYHITIDEFPDLSLGTGFTIGGMQLNIPLAEIPTFFFDMRDFKFELGNKPTDWSPAPEDVQNGIDAVQSGVDGLDQRVVTAEAKIEEHDGQISLRATKTEVTETLNGYYTKEQVDSQILISGNGIISSVSSRIDSAQASADNAQASIDNLQIGGRNLLKNSRHIKLTSNNTSTHPTSSTLMSEGGIEFYRYMRTNVDALTSNTQLSLNSRITRDQFAYSDMAGKQVTLSFKARVSKEKSGTFNNTTFGLSPNVSFNKSSEVFGTEWKTYKVLIDEFPDLTEVESSGVRWNPIAFTLTPTEAPDFYLDVREWKFEFGNKVTDWTPAPEDVQNGIETAQSTATNAQASIDNLQIGGRNLFRDSRIVPMVTYSSSLPISVTEEEENKMPYLRYVRTNTESLTAGTTLQIGVGVPLERFNYSEMTGKQVTFSFKARCSFTTSNSAVYLRSRGLGTTIEYKMVRYSFTPEWRTYHMVLDEFPDLSESTGLTIGGINISIPLAEIPTFFFDIRDFKFELGNKPTDWTPAPEDMATGGELTSVADYAGSAQATADEALTTANEAQTLIGQLKEMILNMVVDDNGGSFITQDGDSITFNVTSLTDGIENLKKACEDLAEAGKNDSAALEAFMNELANLRQSAPYIHMTAVENENGELIPQLEFGSEESPFKLIITNDRIVFSENGVETTYIRDDTLNTNNVQINNNLQQGNAEKGYFIWSVRANGNYGLTWKKGVSINGIMYYRTME